MPRLINAALETLFRGKGAALPVEERTAMKQTIALLDKYLSGLVKKNNCPKKYISGLIWSACGAGKNKNVSLSDVKNACFVSALAVEQMTALIKEAL